MEELIKEVILLYNDALALSRYVAKDSVKAQLKLADPSSLGDGPIASIGHCRKKVAEVHASLKEICSKFNVLTLGEVRLLCMQLGVPAVYDTPKDQLIAKLLTWSKDT